MLQPDNEKLICAENHQAVKRHGGVILVCILLSEKTQYEKATYCNRI